MKDLSEINKELWTLANDADRYTPENIRIAIQDICNDLSETTNVVDKIVDASQAVVEYPCDWLGDELNDRIQALDETLNG